MAVRLLMIHVIKPHLMRHFPRTHLLKSTSSKIKTFSRQCDTTLQAYLRIKSSVPLLSIARAAVFHRRILPRADIRRSRPLDEREEKQFRHEVAFLQTKSWAFTRLPRVPRIWLAAFKVRLQNLFFKVNAIHYAIQRKCFPVTTNTKVWKDYSAENNASMGTDAWSMASLLEKQTLVLKETMAGNCCYGSEQRISHSERFRLAQFL